MQLQVDAAPRERNPDAFTLCEGTCLKEQFQHRLKIAFLQGGGHFPNSESILG